MTCDNTGVAVPLSQPCSHLAEVDGGDVTGQAVSIHSMTTEEWQQAYEADGFVDLWVQEEFNSGSRLVVCPHHIAPTASMPHKINVSGVCPVRSCQLSRGNWHEPPDLGQGHTRSS